MYEPVQESDGKRYLVERLWPRGMSRERLHLDGWLKELAPSDALRRWFRHDPCNWRKFRERYFVELAQQRTYWEPLLQEAQQGAITLLYSARDTQHNNAVALKEFLESQLQRLQADSSLFHGERFSASTLSVFALCSQRAPCVECGSLLPRVLLCGACFRAR